VAHISNDVRDKQKLLMLISTERGNRNCLLRVYVAFRCWMVPNRQDRWPREAHDL